MTSNNGHFNPEKYSNKNLDVLKKKRQDYGSRNITSAGIGGLITRLRDKLSRAEEFIKNGTANFEKMDDVFLDISNYGLIGQMLVGGDWDDEKPELLVYLSGSIDNTLGEDTVTWKQFIKSSAPQHVYFDPAAAFTASRGTPLAYSISTINRFAISECDIMVAHVGIGKCFGTIREIEYAVQQGKIVYAFGYPELAQHVEAHDLIVCDNLVDVLEYLLDATT